MEETDFEILPTTLLKDYCAQISKSINSKFEALKDSELSADTFSFYTSVSAVFSSKIEGEEMEVDSAQKLGYKAWFIHQKRITMLIMKPIIPI